MLCFALDKQEEESLTPEVVINQDAKFQITKNQPIDTQFTLMEKPPI